MYFVVRITVSLRIKICLYTSAEQVAKYVFRNLLSITESNQLCFEPAGSLRRSTSCLWGKPVKIQYNFLSEYKDKRHMFSFFSAYHIS